MSSSSSFCILSGPDIDCLMSSLFHAFLSHASRIRVVGLLPNCCSYVCRCLPRALFPGINEVYKSMANSSFITLKYH